MHLVNVDLTGQLQRADIFWARLWSADYCYFLFEQAQELRSVALCSWRMSCGKPQQISPKGVKVDA